MPIPSGEPIYVADGGVETVMIFSEGFDLPEFAAFPLLAEPKGREALRRYYEGFIEIARRHELGLTLDLPTWRASENWGQALGISSADLAEANREAVEFGNELRAAHEAQLTPIAVCGTLGPEGDAYHPDRALSAGQAEEYHATQIGTFAEAGVDMVAALTLTYTEEAIGIVRAAGAARVPASISFTVETDGRLPSEEPLREAMERLDAETGAAAAYLMINCAHPSHFEADLAEGGAWVERIGGIRANASRRSHEELDNDSELDSGNPEELGREYAALLDRLPGLRVVGGCCGTDQRHIGCICESCFAN
jgi:S-methylmethionine-dependent homocysteine/selenocysteine methylase